MRVERTSPISGTIHVMDLPITYEQVIRWQEGELAQNAFPNLTPDEREFIMTGITPQEWTQMFG